MWSTREEATTELVAHGEGCGALAVEASDARLFSIEMVLPGFARQNLPITGDAEPLRE